MSIDLVLAFDVRVFDGQTPNVEVIADRHNNGVLVQLTNVSIPKRDEGLTTKLAYTPTARPSAVKTNAT